MDLYSALPALRNGQIRLLQVQLTNDGQATAISCTISTHDLCGGSEKPEFFALSYTWGLSHPDIHDIRIDAASVNIKVLFNGEEVSIMENLKDFLYHCASSDDARLQGAMWVDALCINQANVPERSHQVNIMGDIYKAASRVVVWLGPADASSESAFELMDAIITVPKEERLQVHPHDVGDTASSPLLRLRNWEALAQFFQRTWFNRAWIIQEVVFAESVDVRCGSYHVSWDNLTIISHFLATSSWTTYLKGFGVSASNNSALAYGHNTPARLAAANRTWKSSYVATDGFLYALIRARSSSCQDPRDKVYSQLGLGQATIFPDYKLPVAEVYITAAKYILDHSDNLLLLTCVEGEDFQTIAGLPSWVPDWSVSSFTGLRITGYRQFTAAGTLPRNYRLHTELDKHILSIDAVKVDDIVQTCEKKKQLRNQLLSSGLWQLMQRLGKTYITGGSSEEAVWRSLITNRESMPPDQKIHYPATTDRFVPSFRDWILWRCVVCDDSPGTYLSTEPTGTILPPLTEIKDARRQSQADLTYADALAHGASLFDLHYSHSMLLRPFRTKQGYFGIGSQSLREGDSVWIAPGCRVPLIFRPVEGSNRHRLVGGSYVHGIMNGEFVDREHVAFETVRLE